MIRAISRTFPLALPLALLLALLLALPATVAAQRPDALARPMSAYRDLDYDAAATALRAAIAAEGASRLTDEDRLRAYMYLGATETFRGRREAAVEAFRALLALDVRYRPDELVFPPEVSTLFQQTRIGLRALSVVVPPQTTIRSTADRFPIRIYAASLHEIRVSIIDASGGPVRVLHEGAVGDSLELLWNGRDGLGRLREPGPYRLRVTSRSPAGRDEREVLVPLAITREDEDTLSMPEPLPASAFRPETAAPTGGTKQLVTGLGAALAAVALPSIAGSGSDGGTLRFGVAAALGAASAIGFTRAKRPRALTENIEYNRRQRDAWSQEVERIRQENTARRAATRLRIESGRASTVVLP
jgi:hypothetical protein